MVKKNENIDIDTRLKYEMYGRLVTCGILMAAVFLFSWISRNKEQAREGAVKPQIEKVNAVKSIVTDSVAQRIR